MIAAIIAVVLFAALLGCAFHQSLRVGELNRQVSILCAALSIVPLVVGALLYPSCNVWQAERAAQAQIELSQGEAESVALVSGKFADMTQYLEYVKARNK
ncbi:hypothetical protein [Pseudomonas sp.]|jgi:hypothetical protein|uniref:hypothetical protein n=1 Tax=Pseudomonas sp. TaxID=306 RepID=UPI002EDB671C